MKKSQATPNLIQHSDIFIIGGGINGAGIARDASGRGYSVGLAEMNDFASGTSSSSTKLFHGGLRYLEFFKFRLVKEALVEREVLLKNMPHISWPMRFVLPLSDSMRFETDTPTSKLLHICMPWLKGRRPSWLIRLGLFIYDHLGGLGILKKTSFLDLSQSEEGKPLESTYQSAYEYSDCWVEDSRLTLLNVRDAALRGAKIYARTKVIKAECKNNLWHITLKDSQGNLIHSTAKMLVNAGGPWVENIIQEITSIDSKEGVRLVRGSHLVTKKLYEHDKCYFFQGTDGRIMFAIPYEEDFTLLGTTDEEHTNPEETPTCSQKEQDYMIEFVNNYFKTKLEPEDIVWSFSGLRPLYDDGADSATEATRDYVQSLNTSAGAPVLNIFGGKITTYRKLAENALSRIDSALSRKTHNWTANTPLLGGDIGLDKISEFTKQLADKLPFFDAFTIRRLVRQYGTECTAIFAGIDRKEQLGQDFGCGITSHEIDWSIEHEWVFSAEDFLWRRSKMGLRVSLAQAEVLQHYIQSKIHLLS